MIILPANNGMSCSVLLRQCDGRLQLMEKRSLSDPKISLMLLAVVRKFHGKHFFDSKALMSKNFGPLADDCRCQTGVSFVL